METSCPIIFEHLKKAALEIDDERRDCCRQDNSHPEMTPARNQLLSLAELKTEILGRREDTNTAFKKGHFRSQVLEKTTAERTRQLLFTRQTRDNGRFLIEEAVVNFLGENRLLPYSMLTIKDMQTGASIDLSLFLPPGCAFVPSRLLKVRVEFDRHGRRMKSEYFPVNLNTYKGPDQEGEFYFSRNVARVAYGNLATQGALLSLFHEIAHAWQFAREGKSAKKEFSTLFSYLSLRLHNLGVRMEAYKNQAISEEKFHHFIGLAREKLAEKGIELDTASIISGRQDRKDGWIVFTAHSGKRFFFRGHTFADAFRAYIQAERDAWAHAILALRQLHKRGFDLEPQLRCLDDFRKYIYPHLENYSDSINSQLEMAGGDFNPRNKKTRAATRV